MKQRCVLFAIVTMALPAWRPAEAQSLAKLDPVHNLLGHKLTAVAAGSGIQIRREADGAGITAILAPGSTTGSVRLGPVRLPPGARALRFTGALSLAGDPKCRMSVAVSSGGMAGKPATIPFSDYAARIGGVFQDMFIRVPPGADSAKIEFHLTRTGHGKTGLGLRYPCLTAVIEAEPPESEGVAFRHSFSHPDGRADVANGAATSRPAWSCVLPTAEGKTGPGLETEQPQDAMFFALPAQQVMARGHLTFWLRPLWDQGDARPGDMVKLSQRGRAKVLVRKNHGWSFLFVIWDRDGKTRSASCDLRNLTKGHWTKVEAAWDATKGMRLIVNGVTLGKRDCSWPVPPPEPVGVRIGQGEYDKPERAPYVLDEVEILTRTLKGAF